jgi:hypothetical protein
MRPGFIAFVVLMLDLPALAEQPIPHWAFTPPSQPTVPAGGHPVDAFLAAKRNQHGVKPWPQANRRTLLRRVYLDLAGLPPTPEEITAFLNDHSPDAYERVVDRLLASPAHGERWARHWMDVWRYSDWDGFGTEVRNSQPHIWRWRDWIMQSLNADKGYDRMVMEMLAGDELAPDDPDTLRATGFLARNWFLFNRNVWLDNTVEHTAKAFLGLTMNCARCHEHKYDPIAQKEYYQFRAFFEPHEVRLDRIPGQPDPKKDGLPRVFDAKLDAPTYLFHRGDEAKPDKSQPLPPKLPTVFGAKLAIEPVKLSRTAQYPDKRNFVMREVREQSERTVRNLEQALDRAKRLSVADWLLPQSMAGLVTLSARIVDRRNERALLKEDIALAAASDRALNAVLKAEQLEEKGKDSIDWQSAAKLAVVSQRQVAEFQAWRELESARQDLARSSMKPKIEAATKRVKAAEAAVQATKADREKPVTTAYTPRVTTSYPATSTGRRLALAKWIVAPENPLAARVAVNHVWMRHFGRPLVPTVFDFGKGGQPPTHPELLDWLACEFMARGWSMKALHRLIVTSAAYRQESTPDAEALARDPENRWLWRVEPRRLEAEAVRDGVLHVAGNLDRTMGGPDIDQKFGLTVPRRSIYFRHSVEKYVEMLKVFDSANVVECYRRDESIVPQQALALANNPLVVAQARLLARKFSPRVSDEDFINAAFERVLGRPPRPEEIAACAVFLNEQTARLTEKSKLTTFAAGPAGPVPPSAEPAARAREDLIHVLFNHHEFVTIR